jgi:proline dehydrogenase
VKVILDYGVEGKEGEENFDHATLEFNRVIDYASTASNIPYISIKITGFARFALLEQLQQLMLSQSGQLMDRYHAMLAQLDLPRRAEWQRVVDRAQRICVNARDRKVAVAIDAEESWIQEPVDALATLMMQQYNQGKTVVYNTIQLYRHDRFRFLQDAYTESSSQNYVLALKLVRGAYMEKERKRALEMGYASPIHVNKEAVDLDYNQALSYCIDRIDRIAVIVASHNEYSSMLATKLLRDKGLSLAHPHIHFSQLYGMTISHSIWPRQVPVSANTFPSDLSKMWCPT